MELSAKSADGTNILYRESFWSGKKNLFIEGKETLRVGKKQFRYTDGETSTEYFLKGNFLCGVTVSTNKGETVVLAQNKWYDWLLMLFPFIGVIFGVVFCGMIGGGLSALFCCAAMFSNAAISRTTLPIGGKISLQILVGLGANAIWFGLYFFIVLLIIL